MGQTAFDGRKIFLRVREADIRVDAVTVRLVEARNLPELVGPQDGRVDRNRLAQRIEKFVETRGHRLVVPAVVPPDGERVRGQHIPREADPRRNRMGGELSRLPRDAALIETDAQAAI